MLKPLNDPEQVTYIEIRGYVDVQQRNAGNESDKMKALKGKEG